MFKTFQIAYALGIIFISINFLNAEGQAIFSFLNVTPTSRAAALGESFVGVAEGPESVLYNVAGLSEIRSKNIFFQSDVPPLIEEIRQNHFIYVHPLQKGSWSVDLGGLQAGGFTRTVADASTTDGYRETGKFSTYDMNFSFALSRKLNDSFSIGMKASFLRESLSDAVANGVGFDSGLIYKDNQFPVQWGLSIQNVGPKVKFKDESFSMPTVVRTGIMIVQPVGSFIPIIPEKSLFTAEVYKPFYGDISLRGGVELSLFSDSFKLRSGYRYQTKKTELGSQFNIPNGITMGFGFPVKNCQFDFATISMGELGFSHRISISIHWGSKQNRGSDTFIN